MTSSFRAAVEAKDLDAMRSALHPGVVFRSPVVYRPYEGRDAVMVLLGAVVQVFTELWVMIRPLSGLSAVEERMRALLSA